MTAPMTKTKCPCVWMWMGLLQRLTADEGTFLVFSDTAGGGTVCK